MIMSGTVMPVSCRREVVDGTIPYGPSTVRRLHPHGRYRYTAAAEIRTLSLEIWIRQVRTPWCTFVRFQLNQNAHVR